jgi:hypothetical protein
MTFFATASGLMIDRVLSTAMISTFVFWTSYRPATTAEAAEARVPNEKSSTNEALASPKLA